MIKLLRCARVQHKSGHPYRTYALTRNFHILSASWKNAEPISLDEFRRHYQQCLPTHDQGESIAVAFSGGPDSTCLLYLLRQLFDNDVKEGRKPKEVVAITVDHGLQEASRLMTEKCVAIAATLQVKHRVLRIPWGAAPFPSVPPRDSAFENMAREARYHLLLSAMKEEFISTIAFGHHADDQVETALLRVTRGSTEAGVAGMKRRRLWGMGFGSDPGDLGWAGQHGMNRWIIRPLLRLPKERLIATCEDAGLDYAVDKTNFQPEVSSRNRIRYELGNGSSEDLSKGTKALLEMAARVTASGGDRGLTHSILQDGHPASRAQLRSAVESISDFVEQLNHEVSTQLTKSLHSSPVSTILLSKDAFSRVTDNSIRIGIIRRILRFVSPFPWGSPRAEAGRRSTSLQRISDMLTKSGEYSGLCKEDQVTIPLKRFVAGGGVVWSPVRITRNAGVKFSEKGCSSTDEMGWLASRQPPIHHFRESVAKPLEFDITPSVIPALSQECSVEILYDCRFLLHITPNLFPPDVLNALSQLNVRSDESSTNQVPVKLLVIPHTRYFLPKVVLRRTDAQAEFLSGDGDYKTQEQGKAGKDDHEIVRLLPDGSTRTQSAMGEDNKDGKHPACIGEAVRIKYIRVLDTNTSNVYLDQHSM